jgi:hypothetical protein
VCAAEFLERLERVNRSGKGWTARCPAHEDRRASLSISEGDDGRILLKCFAGCPTEDIVEALSLSLSDLFPTGGGGPHSPAVHRQQVNTPHLSVAARSRITHRQRVCRSRSLSR